MIVLGSSIVGLIYVFWQNGFAKNSVKALVIAMVYCWGLIRAIYMMSHGLVAVPRKLYQNADINRRLRRIQGQAPRIYDRLNDANFALEGLDAQRILNTEEACNLARSSKMD
ncbi:hypothetical protein MMC29_003479 [Sticta canariensis]|nr:hypothetical protein [Sticta canariensis]